MALLRRLLAMLLLAVLGLPAVSSSLALGGNTEAGLPACCRRTGHHGCAMSLGERTQVAVATQAPAWKAPAEYCPYCPATAAAGIHLDAAWLRARPAVTFGLWAAAAPVRQAECSHRLARERARGKRGPPVSFLV